MLYNTLLDFPFRSQPLWLQNFNQIVMLPKRSKSKSPVRRLRLLLDLDQFEMGKRVGTSAQVIRNIENAKVRTKVSRDLAFKMMQTFGVHPESMMQDEGIPRTLDGKEYTLCSFNRWKNFLLTFEDSDPSAVIEHFNKDLLNRLRITYENLHPSERFNFFFRLALSAWDSRDRDGIVLHGFTQQRSLEDYLWLASSDILSREGEINSNNQK